MNQAVRTKIIAVVLAIVSIWAVYDQVGENKEKTAAQDTTAKTVIYPAIAGQSAAQVDIEKDSKVSWGRNPFVYRSYAVESDEPAQVTNSYSVSWNLSGILYNPQLPVAIINKKPVQVGDTVADARIVSIEKNKVIIEYNGEKIELKVSRG